MKYTPSFTKPLNPSITVFGELNVYHWKRIEERDKAARSGLERSRTCGNLFLLKMSRINLIKSTLSYWQIKSWFQQRTEIL